MTTFDWKNCLVQVIAKSLTVSGAVHLRIFKEYAAKSSVHTVIEEMPCDAQYHRKYKIGRTFVNIFLFFTGHLYEVSSLCQVSKNIDFSLKHRTFREPAALRRFGIFALCMNEAKLFKRK